MTVIPKGPDAPLTRLQAADALSEAGFPFSKATLATMATRNSAQGLRRARRMSEAGVTSQMAQQVRHRFGRRSHWY